METERKTAQDGGGRKECNAIYEHKNKGSAARNHGARALMAEGEHGIANSEEYK